MRAVPRHPAVLTPFHHNTFRFLFLVCSSSGPQALVLCFGQDRAVRSIAAQGGVRNDAAL